ncbi:hypothetical protein E4U42_003704 [Claviceps africana]|uniref:Uncharacterized protein n=1 Tax=Claviceps africana TaxID=83212 RepID=A0A8K0J6S7_9HYPO|nr:hypothetical protein E4U42_003704 [Claviceps africana]
MGSEPKRASAKQKRSPAKARRSQSRAQDAEASLLSSSATTSSPQKIETPRTARYSHRLPTNEQRRGNGRVPGRSLIMWNRPRMAEKLLLHIQYECSRHKITLPWDAIAHRLHPGSSGQAVCQHIHRLRRELVAEGHLVPPMPSQKSGSLFDPEIRGYTRQNVDTNDLETTRPVTFDERLDDPKLNLPDAANLSDDDFEEEMESFSSPESIEMDLPCSPTPMPRAAAAESVLTESSGLPEVKHPRTQSVAKDEKYSLKRHYRFLLGDDDIEPEQNHSQESAYTSEAGGSLFTDSTSPSHSFASSSMSSMASELATNASLMHDQQDFGIAQQRAALPWPGHHFSHYSCPAPQVPSSTTSFEHAGHLASVPPPNSSNHYSFYVVDPNALRRVTPERTTSGLSWQQVPLPHIGEPMEELFPGLGEGDGRIADTGQYRLKDGDGLVRGNAASM